MTCVPHAEQVCISMCSVCICVLPRLCGCLLLTVASGTEHGSVAAWCSPCRHTRLKGASSQGQPPSKSTTNQLRHNPATATWLGPGTTAKSISSDPPTTPSLTWTPSLLFLHPQKSCFCQKPAAISSGGGMPQSVSHPNIRTCLLTALLIHAHTHTHINR